MSADAVPVIWKTGKWNLQPRIVDESIIRHKPEENGSLIALGAFGLLSPAASALLHNGSTLLLSMDCLTPLLSETKEH